MFDKILLPVDGSENSKKALRLGAELARVHGAEILLLNVYRHHSQREQSLSMVRPSEPEQLDRAQRAYAEEVVQWGAEVAKSFGAQNLRTLVRSGQIARTIIDTARTEEADLIMIGSRGLGDFQSFLLGSVSHKVTSLADVPVLVV